MQEEETKKFELEAFVKSFTSGEGGYIVTCS